MAIVVPIISEFNAKGVKSATQAFNNLEKSTSKIGNAMKSAFLGASAAIASVAFTGYKFAKIAMEDQQVTALLERQIKNSTKATDAQVKATEKYITKTALAVGVTKDKLAPAYAAILRGAKDLTRAQQGLNLALDVSKATGKPLEAVSTALAKAYAGNYTALQRLSPEVKSLVKNHASLNEVLSALNRTYSGAAATAASTMQGKFDRLKVALHELQVEVGTALFPVLQRIVDFFNNRMLPELQKISDAFKEHGLSGAIKTAATDFGNMVGKATGWKAVMYDLAGSVAAVGLAFKTWTLVNGIVTGINALTSALGAISPAIGAAGFGTMATTIGLVAANLILVVDTFRNLEARKDVFTLIAGGFGLIEDAVIGAYQAVRFFVDHTQGLINAFLPEKWKMNNLPDIKLRPIQTIDNATLFPNKQAPTVSSNATAKAGGINTYNINVKVDPTTDRASVGRNIVEAINAYQRRTGVVVPALR